MSAEIEGSEDVRVLITGAGGFAGGHLIHHLQAQPGVELFGAVYLPLDQHPHLAGLPVTLRQIDLRDADAVSALVRDVRPDHIVHLAALANVGDSFRDPWRTLENNILGQLNVLEAVRNQDLTARVLIVSSAEIYGAAGGDGAPLDEDTPLAPANPYSVSKVAQDLLGLQYFLSYGMPLIRARPFNHIGPAQGGGFVAADFASQIAAIEAGQRTPVIHVGNLTAERDFTDVRDVVRAYHLLLVRGEPGVAYNICTGVGYSIQYLLDTLLSFSTAAIEVRQDPARMRPSDVPRRVGDASRLRAHTGWAPTITFEQSLLDILNGWRHQFGLEPRLGSNSGDTHHG